MKKTVLTSLFLFFCIGLCAQWKPAGDKIKTAWAETVTPNNALSEYPRPIMERTDWINLNGLWDYAILPLGENEPQQFDGKILVPFALESSLSGVQKELGKEKELWYKRTFNVPAGWKSKTVLLHFGAVDWKAEIYLNDIKIGSHTGGYTPFSLNITPYLTSGTQKLVVKVWDPATDGSQPMGKQTNHPESIWYTSVSGIWQTVWLEPVNRKHITAVKITPDIDEKKINIKVNVEGASYGDVIEAVVKDNNKLIAKTKSAIGEALELVIEQPELWSPESPHLYDLEICLYDKDKLQDKVKSYAAMRKISIKRGDNGIVRLQLNNKDYFQFGLLDQGWWPDGLYTAPTDEALRYDIQKTKDFGYNMIRKHVKVEPARWYTHCDKLGVLVWQDMPSGGRSPEWQSRQYFTGKEFVRSPESDANYRKEWKEIMDYLYSYPCVVTWVTFNEAWGQSKTEEIVRWTKMYDPSRLVNPASGGNHYRIGDMLDLHNYPAPALYLYDAERATVLGEYGGIGFPMGGHLWQPDKNWGYVQFKNTKEVTDEYVKYAEMLKEMSQRGFSAAVYTQTTDVEGEVNGLITYDRKEIKIEEERVRKVNQEVRNSIIK